MTVGVIIATLAVIAGILAIPWTPVTPEAEAAGPTAPASGAFTVSSTVTPSTLPVGGGDVKITYTVTNTSKEGNRYLFYMGDSNSVCTSTTPNGLIRGTYDDYIPPGGTATFTCTASIRQTTDIKQTFKFDSYDAAYRTGIATETVQLTDKVTVATATGGLGTCDTPWYTAFDAPGEIGTVSTTGQTLAKWPINFVTTRQYQERNSAGQLLYWAYDSYYGTYYKTTYNTGSPVMVGENRVVTGSSGMAVDPTNPQYAYFSGRDGDWFSDELYRIDLLTGQITSLGTSPAFASNRMSVDADGTLWSFANDGVLYSVPNVNSLTQSAPLDAYSKPLSSTQVVSHGVPTYFDKTSGTTKSFASLQSGDIAFDGAGTMYVLAAPASTSGSKVPTVLIAIDPDQLTKSSGVVGNLIGDMGTPTLGSYFNGLAFDTKGNLYASSTDATTNTSGLYVIDMNTGKPTLITASGVSGTTWGDLSSCALPTPRLTVTKTANPNPVPENGIVTYTIQIKNIGEINATGATFQDAIPAGTTYVAGSTKLNGTAIADVNGTSPFVTTREVHGTMTNFAGVIPKGDTATVTFQVKVAAGQTKVCNQGTATFISGEGAILSDDPTQSGGTDSTCVDVLKPSVQIVKSINNNDANTAPGVSVPAGSNMTITLDVTNTGNAPLTNVTVTDNRVAANSIVCEGSSQNNNIVDRIEAGRSTTCTATLLAPAAGQTHANTANVVAVPTVPNLPSQPPVSDTDNAYAFTPGTPAISISKLINGDPADTAPGVQVPIGKLMNISFVVTNSGTSVLNNVKVTDDKVQNILCPKTTLAVGESMTCTGALMAPAPGVQHTNVATVTATPALNPDGTQPPNVTATNPANAYVPVSASIDLVKKINGQDVNEAPGVIVEPGQPLNVTFEVTNTSNVQLTGVKVADDKLTNITCPKDVLGIGEKMICTATLPALQPGQEHVNTATVTGIPPKNLDGTPATPVTDTDKEYARAKAAPAIEVIKKINGDDANLVPGVAVPQGSTMNVTFDVTNKGNLPLVDVKVTDDKITNITCPKTTLAVGETMQCTGTMPAPDPNVQHSNLGTATASPQLPDGTLQTPINDTDPANAFVAAAPKIEVIKKINGDDANTAPGVTVTEGQTLNFTFEVRNTGNVTVTGVSVTDDKVVGIECPKTELAAGETMICTATGTAAAPGVQHTNTAKVVAQPPTLIDGSTPPVITDDDPANALVPAAPGIKIMKKINDDDANTAPGVSVGEGSEMAISFDVTNTGNVTLTGVTVTDDKIPAGSITCPTDTILPGQTITCHAVLAAPAVGAQHTNTGEVTANPPANPDGTPATPVTAEDPANATAVAKPVPGIDVVKSGNGFDANAVPGIKVEQNSTINYNFHVSNTGNTVLDNVNVTDDKIANIVCPKNTLAPGEEMDCTATGPAPAPGEQHTNIATASGTDPAGTTVTNEDPFNAFVPNAPAVTIKKMINGDDANTAPGVSVAEGSQMEITYLVTNTGNTELTNVVVGDDKVSTITCPQTTLAAGASMTCTATLAAPAPNEQHTNLGYVTADTPPNIDGTPNSPVSAEDPANAIVPAAPSIQVVKKINGDDANTAPGVTLADGEAMNFTFDVTNTGNVPLTGITLEDPFLTSIACPKVDLAPGETMQCTAGAEAPAPGQQHTNNVKVTATPPQNPDGSVPPVVTDEDPANAIVEARPGIDVTKFLNGEDANTAPGITVAEGSTMAVAVHVVNTGNVPLVDVKVTDDKVTDITCPKNTLAVGEDMYCLGSIAAPASGTLHQNTATGTGAVPNPDGTPSTNTVTDSDPAFATGTDKPAPAIEVIKKINGDDANTAPGVHVGEGTLMDVTFTVTNIGNTDLRNVTVTDDMISAVTCPKTELAAGESMECSALVPAPAVGAQHTNMATATGTQVNADGSDGAVVDDTNPANAVADETPEPIIAIIKRINDDDANTAPGVEVVPGSTMNVTFEVMNLGNTVITNLKVIDDKVAAGDIIPPTYKYTREGYIVPFDGTLAPGEWTSADASLKAPEAGQTHVNNATVTGDYTAPDGTVTPVEDHDPANAWAPGAPSFTVEKKINGEDADTAPGVKVEPGSTMNIEIVVTNTGNVPLTEVTVTDDKISNLTCPADTTLPVGGTITCTATMPAPAANEQHTNTATVTAKPPANPDGSTPELPPVTDPGNAYSGTFADISIEKRINGDDADTEPGVLVTPGSMMNIEFVVTNTGSVKLSDVKVSDSKILDGITCPKTELASGEEMICTATYPAPVDGGMVHDDVATAEGTPPVNLDGTVPPSPKASDPAYAHTPGVAGIQVIKKINGDDANTAPGVLVTPGQPMNVEFEVTNTGSVDLTEIKVTDDKIDATDIVCPKAELAPFESMTCTATIPAIDNAQTHSNVASVVGKPPANPDGSQPPSPTDTDEAHAHTPGVPGISIEKRINTDDADVAPGVAMQPGETMYLTFYVTNTGSTVLNDIKVTDDKVAPENITCPQTSLNPGESMTCSAELPAPAGTGQMHTNVATVIGTPPANPDGSQPTPPTATDEAHAYTPGLASIEIIKKLNGDDAETLPGVSVDALAPMNFTFDVTNTGQVPLKSVTVTDDKLTGITCPKTELAPGEGMQCTAMMNAPTDGTHTNTATVVGTPINTDGTDGTPVTDGNVANATIVPAPAPTTPGIAIVKKINGADANEAPGILLAAGDTMDITFEVSNTGTAPLIDVKVTDDKVGAVTCPQTTLLPGEVMTCTASAPAPAPGVQHTNTGTVTGTGTDDKGNPLPDGGVEAKDPANAFVPVTPGNPGVMVVKKINGQDAELTPGVAVEPGKPMTVTFDVTNFGDVALTGVKVTDDKIANITCPKTDLAAGETMTCTGELAAPEVGVQHSNTATVIGTPVPNPGEPQQPPVTDTDKGNAYVPGVKLVKKINGDDANTAPGVSVEAGSDMTVTFEVTNTGLATLTDIVLTDSVIPGELTCPKKELLPGETMTCETTLTAPAVGVQHTNTGKVVAKPVPNPDGTTAAPVEATDPANATPRDIPRTPGIQVVKKINGDDANELPGVSVREGETMDVTFEVVNTGNSLLTQVKVTDDKIQNVVCEKTELHVGETMICTGTMPAPKAGESHTNTATAVGVGVDLSGKEVGTVQDTDPANATSLTKAGHPAIQIVKLLNGQDASSAPGVAVPADQPMAITFEVTNTGDVELTGVSVTDDKVTGITCPKNVLAPGEQMTCTGSLAAPAVGDQHTNVAKVIGTPTPNTGEPQQPPVEDEDNANAYVPAIEVVKKINGEDANDTPVTVPADAPMFVTFEVTNKGLAALINVKLTDDVIKVGITCPKDALLPGETMVCTATAPAPAEGTEHINTATVIGEVPPNPDGSQVPPVKDEDTARAVVPPAPAGKPGVSVVKKINGDDANTAPGALTQPGSMMDITFEVTNTGETKLINVAVTDDQASVTCPQTDLAIGETMICTAQLPAPVAGSTHTNMATVIGTGVDEDGKEVGSVNDTDPANAHTPAAPGTPGIVLVKKINGQDASVVPGVAVAEGSVMDITFEVTNTGDVELMDISVTDDKVAGITCPSTTLLPGETMTCTATEFAPAAGTQHTNVGKVVATPSDPLLPPVTDEDNANAYTPGIKVIKKINGDDADVNPVTVPRGVDMFVTFEVTNTGLAALTDVQLTDDVIASGITCPQTTLAPGETMLCYATLPAPADGVTHVNNATVIGNVPSNPDGPSVPPVKDENPAKAVVTPKPEAGTPAVKLVKKINGDDANTAPGVRVDAESDMAITFEVTNVGETILRDVIVTDDKLADITCPKTEIHVGETIICTGTLKAPTAGKTHTNIGEVTARGYDQEGLPVGDVSATDPANAYALPKEGHPSVVIIKKINGQDASLKPGVVVDADSDMAVTFEVTNNGDVDLTDVTVTDNKISEITCPKNALAVGESMTCTGTLKAPAAGDQHENVAKVVATPKPNDGEPQQPPVSDEDNANAYVPAIEVIKMINGDDANEAPGVKVVPGTTMEVTFKVTNKGLGALNDIKLTDDKIAADKITCPKYDLLPGESMTCRATIDTPADGVQHVNTAKVVGQPPALADGTPVKPVEDSDVAHAIGTTKPSKPNWPDIPWWIIPIVPIVGGLIGSSESSSGSSEPGTPVKPAPGQPGQPTQPGQPQKGIPGKGFLAQTGVENFGLIVGIASVAALLGLGFLAWSKRRKQ